MSFDVSPEHISAMQAERQQIEEEDDCERVRKAQAQSDAQFVRQSWDMGAVEDSAVRKKPPKKSNAPRSSDMAQNLHLDQAPPANDVGVGNADTSSRPQIPVKQDTLSVMDKMFPARADGTKGVRWIQFLTALKDAGLTPKQSSAGSAVSFGNEQGAVTIHMPHPEPEVDAVKLRGHGKRLAKWFGWKRDTSVLRQKEAQEDASK